MDFVQYEESLLESAEGLSIEEQAKLLPRLRENEAMLNPLPSRDKLAISVGPLLDSMRVLAGKNRTLLQRIERESGLCEHEKRRGL
jgi:hypothetical protein